MRSTVVQWIGVAFGVLILLGATGRLTAAPVQALATALFAFAVILPFAWTIRCRHRDRRAFLAWTQEIETTRRIAPYPTPTGRCSRGSTTSPRRGRCPGGGPPWRR
ncbi:hypothetical protein [Corynebacterium bovis]|uniref:hypothetical protein n=1 Tax=Corynebacterium bovis TaxID=36808 RepID=UPI000F6419D5|nr:hypothetical protein [Corynebacterium bovis]RRQ09722.1 hypothetical protein CXF44_07115 [Corynebacterium bovis]